MPMPPSSQPRWTLVACTQRPPAKAIAGMIIAAR
jgi:hypothetical protein